MSFASEGYQIINIGNKRELVNLRKTFIDIFSLASKLNGYKAIKSEKNIIDLYKKKKLFGSLDMIKLECYQR